MEIPEFFISKHIFPFVGRPAARLHGSEAALIIGVHSFNTA